MMNSDSEIALSKPSAFPACEGAIKAIGKGILRALGLDNVGTDVIEAAAASNL